LDICNSNVAFRHSTFSFEFWCFRCHDFGSVYIVSGLRTKNAVAPSECSVDLAATTERWDNRNIRFGVPSKRLLPSNKQDYTWWGTPDAHHFCSKNDEKLSFQNHLFLSTYCRASSLRRIIFLTKMMRRHFCFFIFLIL